MGSHSTHRCTACGLRTPRPSSDPSPSVCPACGGRAEAEPAFATPAAQRPDLAPAAEVAVLLDNVRSLANVGAIFRSADGVGAAHVYLAGITPTPDHPKLTKTALGAERSVPWTHGPDALALAEAARAAGFALWVLEGDGDDLLSGPVPPRGARVCLVAGHERAGVDPRLRARAERCVRIPMCGIKDSLNVAAAVTVALYCVRFGLAAGGAAAPGT